MPAAATNATSPTADAAATGLLPWQPRPAMSAGPDDDVKAPAPALGAAELLPGEQGPPVPAVAAATDGSPAEPRPAELLPRYLLDKKDSNVRPREGIHLNFCFSIPARKPGPTVPAAARQSRAEAELLPRQR